jgi:lipopolysaccharide export system permease protein
LLDRYIAIRMARPFTAVVVIVMLLLSLENTTRLLGQIAHVQRPLAVLAEFMSYLLPEYLAIALLFALFIGVSMSLRGLSLSGELDIFASVGLSPARMLRMPFIIAGVCAVLLFVTRGYIEPWGERKLDDFGSAVRAGELGMAIKAGEFYSPSGDVTFHADSIDDKRRSFKGVMVHSARFTAFAQSARAINGGRRGLLIILRDGQIISVEAGGKLKIVRFDQMYFPVRSESPIVTAAPTRGESNRQYLGELIDQAVQSQIGDDRDAARSALAARLAAALALPLLPLLAIGLCVPPKRQTGALGIGLGVIAIVAFVQAIHAFEDSTAPSAPLAIALLWATLALISYWSWLCHTNGGPGFIEDRLGRGLAATAREILVFAKFLRTYPSQVRIPRSSDVLTP